MFLLIKYFSENIQYLGSIDASQPRHRVVASLGIEYPQSRCAQTAFARKPE